MGFDKSDVSLCEEQSGEIIIQVSVRISLILLSYSSFVKCGCTVE